MVSFRKQRLLSGTITKPIVFRLDTNKQIICKRCGIKTSAFSGGKPRTHCIDCKRYVKEVQNE